MKNVNGQNIRKTAAAAIAALTMVLTASCGLSENTVKTIEASIPAVSAAETSAPVQTEISADVAEAEESQAEEKEIETAAEKKSAENKSKKETGQEARKEAKKESKTAAKTAAQTKAPESKPAAKPAPQTKAPEKQSEQPKIEETAAPDLDNMNVYDLMEYSIAELTAYSDFTYINDLVGFQGSNYVGIVLDKYPQYAFIAARDLDGTNPVLADKYGTTNSLICGPASYVNVFNGGYIGSACCGDVVIGMSYCDIKNAVNEDFGVYISNDSCGACAEVYLNGRTWRVTFDLTQEQIDEIYRRQSELAGGEVNWMSSPDYRVDISDMNPTSCAAVAETFV